MARWQRVLWDMIVDGIIWERTPMGFEHQASASSDSIELGNPFQTGLDISYFVGHALPCHLKIITIFFFWLTT